MKNIAKIIIKYSVDALWLLSVFFGIAAVASMMDTHSIGKTGWEGYMYFGLACMSFLILRVLSGVGDWLERPTMEEI